MNIQRIISILLSITFILTAQQAERQQLFAQRPEGSIRGLVRDAVSGEPLVGVNVLVADTTLGAATDADGAFHIVRVPAGMAVLHFRYIGYETLVRTDVDVRPGRTADLRVVLREQYLETGEVVMTADYFAERSDEAVSALGFTREEVRRAPGSGGDVSRVLQSLSATAQVADNSNDLMVRGGSPFENGYYVDGFMVPNINHYPTQGASGGAMGIINVDLVDDVSFLAGGFSAAYGDRLSSVIDISLRDGSRQRFEGQLDMSMAGFGGVAEGPLPVGDGSWLLSGRRSYLDLVTSFTSAGEQAPRYGDIHAKLQFSPATDHRLSVLNIFGESLSSYSRQDAIDNGVNFYGDYDSWQNTTGVSWRWMHGRHGYTTTSLSWSAIHFSNDAHEVRSGEERSRTASTESTLRLRSRSVRILSANARIEAGVDAALAHADYSSSISPFTDQNGQLNPGSTVEGVFRDPSAGAHASLSVRPLDPLEVTLGLRTDYFGYTDAAAISPRASLRWRVSELLTASTAWGIYHQQLPMVLLTQDEDYRSLLPTRAKHVVVGLEYLLQADTKLGIEVYRKDYENFPMSGDDPLRFIIDDGRYDVHFGSYSSLESSGEARAEGVELMLQKKLSTAVYGTVSASLFRTRYRDLHGSWRSRLYDNRYIVSIMGGYRPSPRWEFSARFVYAGGIPYTPFDAERSTAAGTGIIDANRVHALRQPDYHILDLRADHRFLFEHSSLVAYLSVWNVYNRKNVAAYYWNEHENRQGTAYQFGLLPILGVEWEF